MKKIDLITGLIYFFSLSNAQITTRELPAVQEISRPKLYDSTSFWNYPFRNNNDIKQYIGQKIYILPYSERYKNQNYHGFYTSPIGDDWRNSFKVNIDSFAKKYLMILDATVNDSRAWTLKLLFQNKDTIYYISDMDHKYTDLIPFILPAFFEKSKNEYINKIFVVNEPINSRDANSGAIIKLNKGEQWVCIDVTLVDFKNEGTIYDFYKPVLVFKNSEGNEIFVNFVTYIDIMFEYEIPKYYYSANTAVIDNFSKLEDYELTEKQKIDEQNIKLQKANNQRREIIQKFGDYFGNLINNNKIVIGMTKEMCLSSWGSPLFKNETITSNGKFEIWQYNFKTFLYFEKSTLKMINQ